MNSFQIVHGIAAVWLAVCNLTAFFLCGSDKRRAKQPGKRRVPEKTLFLWAAVGGSAGLWIGMRFFHHKTRHWYFVWGVPAILLLQAAAVGLLHGCLLR